MPLAIIEDGYFSIWHNSENRVYPNQLRVIDFYIDNWYDTMEGKPEWLNHITGMSKEFGEALSKVSEAMSDDGDISLEEITEKNLIEEVQDLIEKAAAFKTALETKAYR